MAAPHGTEAELLQAVLGLAFTVQQESVRALRQKRPQAESLAEGLHPALERIAACARNLTDASGAAIALGGTDAMVCVARSGVSAPPIGASFDASSGLSGECIRTGDSAICVNAPADPRVNYQSCRALNIASLLYLPLRSAQGKIIGVLGVFSAQPLHFSQRDVSCLRFTEVLVQEALGRTTKDPDPATLAVLLRNTGLPTTEEVGPRTAGGAEVATELRNDQAVQGELKQAAAKAKDNAEVASREARANPTSTPVAELRPEPIFVGRVVDESVQDWEANADEDRIERRSRIPLLLAGVAALVIALAVWKSGYLVTPKPAKPATSTLSVPAPAPPPEATPKATTTDAAQRALTPNVSLLARDGSATVTIELPKAIRYEGYQLSHPDRIYFDLHGVRLTDVKGAEFSSDKGLVSGVRISDYAAGITRIVFDLREPASFEATLKHDPERLIIQLRRTAAIHTSSAEQTRAPTQLTIVVDPGHGGRDLGTVSPSGLREKDLTLDVAKRLGALLRTKLGAKVIYTRDRDKYVSLDERASIANRAHADFMISIHGNSSNISSVRGVETYYFQEPAQAISSGDATLAQSREESAAARAFAADVNRALLKGLEDPEDPMRDRGVKSASFVVLREAQMPAVLAEISFLSNRKDQPLLWSAEYREQIAKALFHGIAHHIATTEPHTTSSATLQMHEALGTP